MKNSQPAEQKTIVKRGCALHVDDCPISVRTWNGKSYANVIDDCTCCDFYVQHNRKSVVCRGKSAVKNL